MFSVSFDRNTFIHSEVILDRTIHTARSRWNHLVKKNVVHLFLPNHFKIFMQMNWAFQKSNQIDRQKDRMEWKSNLNLKHEYFFGKGRKIYILYFVLIVNKLTYLILLFLMYHYLHFYLKTINNWTMSHIVSLGYVFLYYDSIGVYF